MARKRVVIVGTGPTGLFAALELSKNPNLEIIIFESGPHRKERTKDNLLSGLGGAGFFSDGKLTLPNPNFSESLEVGGKLTSIIGNERYLELVDYVNQVYTDFGGRAVIYEQGKDDKIQELVNRAFNFGLRVIPTRIRHFGSDLSPKIIENIVEELKRRGVQIYLETPVRSIRKEGKNYLVETTGKTGGVFKTKYVIVAPGRVGAEWLVNQAKDLEIEIEPRENYVDVGVRVEVPAHVMKPITEILYDAKIECYPKPFKERTRTFCMCPYGEVLVEEYQGLLLTVNGHSLYEKPLSKNTNFAILVSSRFTEPFKEPIKYGQRISELFNMLGGEVLVQRLGDLRVGKRSKKEKIKEWLVKPTLKEATPGDLSFAVPHRQMVCILEALARIDNLVPGVNGDETLLYGGEVKFYSNKIKTSPDLEATENFFTGGDGAGISRGLLQSSISGVVIARSILNRV